MKKLMGGLFVMVAAFGLQACAAKHGGCGCGKGTDGKAKKAACQCGAKGAKDCKCGPKDAKKK